jgi:hypothetical protein
MKLQEAAVSVEVKKFWEDQVAYFPLYDTDRIEIGRIRGTPSRSVA